jgi:hypothetical protein
MTTKLTLTIEEEVISNAKLYASQKGRSLSDLVESYLRTLAGAQKPEEPLSPRVKRLVGSVTLAKDFNYKKELEAGIHKKHTR